MTNTTSTVPEHIIDAIEKAEDELDEIRYTDQLLYKPDFIKVDITTPRFFDFDINEVLYLLKYTDITTITDEDLLDAIIDRCIYLSIIGYDDVYYYAFGQREYDFVRNEVKKHIYTQLNLDI